MVTGARAVSLGQIAGYLEKKEESIAVYGNLDNLVFGASSFDSYKEGTVTWIKNIQSYYKLNKEDVNPALVVIDREIDEVSKFENRLVCNNPKYIFALILHEFFEEKCSTGIGCGSFISSSAVVEENVYIGSGCIIEDDVIVGNGTKIYHNVVIRKGTVIGKNCTIKSCTVIGEEGCGYSMDNGRIIHVPHMGNVVIGDEAEIGSNCSIDRGTMESTVIGERSKIDNLCHIAHNAQIGKGVMIVAGSIICGSAHIKDGSYIAPGGIIRNQIEIGERCIVGMGAVVTKDVADNKVMVGAPARVIRENRGKENL